MRTKILLPVAVAVVGTGVVSWTGIAAARSATTAEMQRNVDDTAASAAEIAVNVTAIADAASAGKATVDASHGSVATLAELSGDLRRTVQRFRY
ncbi:hypothetical protein ACPPVO_20870 [Dactylosporangium sp. McL0621]|uniref:hypothetical protein n=1 Tax=Dactylosporangium sp. McL0621 TaxID=3415678 RepID=UPI003CECE841